jgi:hypothetical protein
VAVCCGRLGGLWVVFQQTPREHSIHENWSWQWEARQAAPSPAQAKGKLKRKQSREHSIHEDKSRQ